MARQLRIQYPGALYHVTARGNERKNIYKSQRDRVKFLEYLTSASVRYEAVIHCYCLMNNHYHLLIETPAGNISQIMRHINGAYTTYFNVKRQRAGHLFQGRFKAILVEADSYALELSRYIHLNPVRAGMVERPEEHSWSSYGAYIGEVEKPEWLKDEMMLAVFDDDRISAENRYRIFVQDKIGVDYENPLKKVVAATILGKEPFVKKIQEQYVGRGKVNRDLPAVGGLPVKPGLDRICSYVAMVLGGETDTVKKVGIYLCHRYSGVKLKQIGQHYGVGESAVSQASSRLAKRMQKDESLRLMVEKLSTELGLSRV